MWQRTVGGRAAPSAHRVQDLPSPGAVFSPYQHDDDVSVLEAQASPIVNGSGAEPASDVDGAPAEAPLLGLEAKRRSVESVQALGSAVDGLQGSTSVTQSTANLGQTIIGAGAAEHIPYSPYQGAGDLSVIRQFSLTCPC